MISQTHKSALFAGGCFWCIGADIKKVPSVISAISGYAGGTTANPTYENYALSGHREVVEVTYDTSETAYEELVRHFIQSIDPTDGGGSFHDRGAAYSPAIYYETPAEKQTAEKVLSDVAAMKVYDKPLAVEVLPRPKFWPAEEYHQDYDKKNPAHYALYRKSSGRDAFIDEHSWKKKLTPEAYKALREKGTEAPFSGKLLHESRDGLYRCAACGNPLFPSDAKFDSGTGWPSFDKAFPGAVREIRDESHGMERVEIVCAKCGSHLGHVFDDGPTDTGKRYCMNSVCLGFDEKKSES